MLSEFNESSHPDLSSACLPCNNDNDLKTGPSHATTRRVVRVSLKSGTQGSSFCQPVTNYSSKWAGSPIFLPESCLLLAWLIKRFFLAQAAIQLPVAISYFGPTITEREREGKSQPIVRFGSELSLNPAQ